MTDIATEQQMMTLPVQPKWTAYSSCEVLPLTVFIDCLLDNEYHKLITNWESLAEEERPTEQELSAIWLPLYSDYGIRTGSDAMAAILLQVWQRDCLATRIKSIKALIRSITETYSTIISDCLGLWGYGVKPFTDEESFESELRVLHARIKGEEFQLKKMDEVLNSMKGAAIDRSDFRKQLMDISKAEGYRLRIDELMTAEYCDYVKRYREYVDYLNEQANKNGVQDW